MFCSSTDDGSLPSHIGHCLADRAKKGFNILYGVGVAEISDMTVPNVFRDLPLVGYDIMQLNERYWTWVDTVIGKADVVGVRVALVPTWGSWITVGVAIFTRTTRCEHHQRHCIWHLHRQEVLTSLKLGEAITTHMSCPAIHFYSPTDIISQDSAT